jgi:hypothetical protein
MVGPKQSEEEWFAKFEIQMIRDARRKRERALKEKEEKASKPTNYMLCPRDGEKLKGEKIGEISVDICPKCEGIWLDRGELEEILLAKEENKKNTFRKILGLK